MTALALRMIGLLPVREACGERRACGEVLREGVIEVAWGGGIVFFLFLPLLPFSYLLFIFNQLVVWFFSFTLVLCSLRFLRRW